MADQEKKSGSGARWVIRLIVLGALAYFFHPIVMPPRGEQPASSSNDDFITLKFSEAGNEKIYQELTAYRDGRNIITITRKQGDPDIPESGNWGPKMQAGIITFHKEGELSAEVVKRFFQDAIDAGVVGLQDMSPGTEGKLQVTTSFGGQQKSVTGPAFVPRAYHWNPSVWKQQIRWQRLGLAVDDDAQLKNYLKKKEITLVNE